LQSSTLESNFVFTRAPHSPRARPVRGCDDTLKEGTTIFIIYWADYGRLRYSSEALQMCSRYMLLLGNVLQDLRIQCRSCRYRLGSQCQWIVDTGPISLSNVMRIDVRTGGPVYRIHRHTVAETSKRPSLPVVPLRDTKERSPHRWSRRRKNFASSSRRPFGRSIRDVTVDLNPSPSPSRAPQTLFRFFAIQQTYVLEQGSIASLLMKYRIEVGEYFKLILTASVIHVNICP
jgi:hypothetical protein